LHARDFRVDFHVDIHVDVHVCVGRHCAGSSSVVMSVDWRDGGAGAAEVVGCMQC
jgi:hypothetical protein